MNNTFKNKKLVEKIPYIPKEIKYLMKLKSGSYKLFMKINDHFYHFHVLYLYEKIGKLLESYHSNRFNKVIEKSKHLKQLFSNINTNSSNKISDTFLDCNKYIITDENTICNPL
jgi:hypothetical protein